MLKVKYIKSVAMLMAVLSPLVIALPVYAATPTGVSNIEAFIKSIITVMAGLAGLIATAFIIIGGFSYITSTGNPEHLDRAKRTILYAAIGLVITIGAFVLSNIVTTLATNAFGS